MKGLNIKKIAALGLGAALIGSALAPAVMAAAYDNLSTKLTSKSQIIDATSGSPVVDVIVGTIGQPADVIWAGNIAAKVAQMAVVPVAGSGTKTVDITVGGTASVTGAGDTEESAVDFTNPETAFSGISVTDSKMPTLVNNTSAKLTWAGTESTVTVKEVLKGTADVDIQGSTSSSAYKPGALFASVNAADLNYTVELGGSGIPLVANAFTNLDGNSDYDVKIPFLGKVYKLDAVTADSLIMYADTTPTDLKVGEKLTVTPNTAYVGKKMEVQLVDLIQVGSGNQTYQPKWALVIDGVATKYVQKGATTAYDLRTEFGKSYFTDRLFVTAAGLNLAANTYTATVRTGADRIELKNGKGYPFMDDSTVDNYAAWKVVLTGNPVTKISLVNQWAYTKTSGTEASNSNSKYVLQTGESVTLPNDFAKFSFTGLQTKGTTEVDVGTVSGIDAGGIKYTDVRGNTVSVPFYKQFNVDFNTPTEITIAGKDYTFWMDSSANLQNDANIAYISGKHSDAISHTTWATADTNKNIIDTTATVSLDLGAQTSTGGTVNTDYLVTMDGNSGSGRTVGLILKGQTFQLQNKAKSTARPKLVFRGTMLNGAKVAAYVPNTEDFLNTILANSQGAWVSTKHMAADLLYTDNTNYTTSLYLDSGDTAKVWEYKAIKGSDNNLLGPAQDANTADWSLGTDVTDPLLSALTQDGTEISTDGSMFTIMVPDENRNAEVYLGGTGTSTTTTGGTSYTGVKAGETKGNVTVTAIAGATTGVAVTKVGNIVKADSDIAGAKSILVGGWLANTKVAKSLMVDGQTLESRLVASGDSVAAVLDNGSVVVAGWTASDTAMAAQKLITALDALA